MGHVVRIQHQGEDQGTVTGFATSAFATVREVHGDRVVYERRRRKGEATIASACLLEPQVGDRVLIVEEATEAYVLGVLARSSEEPARLRVEGDLELSIAGRLRIAADQGIDFATEKALRFVSSALTMRAVEGELAIDRVALFGREAVVNTRAVKFIAGVLESFVESLEQHVTRSYRTVEEIEQLRAKRIDYRTQEELSMRGKHAFVHASDLVKVTGAQIHMG